MPRLCAAFIGIYCGNIARGYCIEGGYRVKIILSRRSAGHEETMTIEKKRTLTSVALFIGIFAGLAAVATFFDMEISRILTARSLSAGDFYTDNVYANVFEAVGMFPRYAMPAFATIILMWAFGKSTLPRVLRVVLFLGGYVYAVYLLSGAFRDLVEYPLAHVIAKYELFEHKDVYYPLKPYFYVIEYFFSAAFVTLGVYATRKIPYKTWCKLVTFAIAVFVIRYLTGHTVSALKNYVDRVRFRTMNCAVGESVGGFDAYTRWYEVTHNADAFRATILTEYKDAFRSFPSGHTSNAGASYALLLLIPALEIKDRRVKAALIVGPVLWTGLTAVSRIVAGAHFMSDVLFGGTIAFLYAIIVGEVLVCRLSHVRALFRK